MHKQNTLHCGSELSIICRPITRSVNYYKAEDHSYYSSSLCKRLPAWWRNHSFFPFGNFFSCFLFIESQQMNVKKRPSSVGTYNYAGLFSEIFLGKQKDPIHSVAPLSPFKFKKYFTCNKFLLITKLINRSIYFGFNILKKNFRGHDVFQFNINALIFII